MRSEIGIPDLPHGLLDQSRDGKETRRDGGLADLEVLCGSRDGLDGRHVEERLLERLRGRCACVGGGGRGSAGGAACKEGEGKRLGNEGDDRQLRSTEMAAQIDPTQLSYEPSHPLQPSRTCSASCPSRWTRVRSREGAGDGVISSWG